METSPNPNTADKCYYQITFSGWLPMVWWAALGGVLTVVLFAVLYVGSTNGWGENASNAVPAATQIIGTQTLPAPTQAQPTATLSPTFTSLPPTATPHPTTALATPTPADQTETPTPTNLPQTNTPSPTQSPAAGTSSPTPTQASSNTPVSTPSPTGTQPETPQPTETPSETPTRAPISVTCPGNQLWNGTECACPPDTVWVPQEQWCVGTGKD